MADPLINTAHAYKFRDRALNHTYRKLHNNYI